jgi:tetratricopeptide (TPR) repeat protein
MEEFLRDAEAFLDYSDLRILRAVSRDETASLPILKIFENPENAGKYLVILKDRPKALFVVAKLANRISKYFKGSEGEVIYDLFLKAIRIIKDYKDPWIKNAVFLLLKETIERKLREGDFEEAASLVSEFHEYGFKNYFKRILLVSSELAEKGDFERAVNIINRLAPSARVNDLKTQLYLEWGKRLRNLGDYTSAEIQLKEALRYAASHDTLLEISLTLSSLYERQRMFEKAYNQILKVEPQNPVEEMKLLREAARILMEWGSEVEKKDKDEALEKYNQAYQLALRIGDVSMSKKAVEKARKVLSQTSEGKT